MCAWRHYPSRGSGTIGTRPLPRGADGAASLPLKGIRNETQALRRPPTRRETHYPSRGSGTGLYLERRPSPGRLTTPQGDQEQPRRKCRREAFNRSLPLKGIRNSPAAHVSSRRPTPSLPLKGIRNHRRGRERSGYRRHFTTPQGDQEHGRAAPRARQAPAHYPSRGSGTGGTPGPQPRRHWPEHEPHRSTHSSLNEDRGRSPGDSDSPLAEVDFERPRSTKARAAAPATYLL